MPNAIVIDVRYIDEDANKDMKKDAVARLLLGVTTRTKASTIFPRKNTKQARQRTQHID